MPTLSRRKVMDLQSFIDKTIKAQRKAKLEESHQMTLGELIKKLEAVEPKQGDDEQSVVFDFEVEWYKYLGRGTEVNMPITPDEINEMLKDCLNSLEEE